MTGHADAFHERRLSLRWRGRGRFILCWGLTGEREALTRKFDGIA